MKIIIIKNSFRSRLDLFVIGWKHIRKFPNYSLKKEIKQLLFPEKIEVMIG